MSAANVLLKPEECAMLLVDFQAGSALVLSPSHGNSWSTMLWDWHELRSLSNPVIASTSASRVYSGPLLPALQ